MLFALIKQLFQNLKHYLYRLYSLLISNVDEKNLIDGDELMGKQEKVIFTESEYQKFVSQYPAASPAIVTNKSEDGVTTYYLRTIKDLSDLQKREGNNVISDECIDYAKSIKNKKSPDTEKKKTQKTTKKIQYENKSLPEPDVIDKVSAEVSKLDDDKKVESRKTIELNSENINTQEISNESLITTEKQQINSNKLISTTSESSSIEQNLDSLANLIDIQEKLTTWRWRRLFDAVVGSSHLRANPPIPCQDSALAVLIPRPSIFVADGAGSARLSHFGSSNVVKYLNRFTASIEDINQEILDQHRQEDIEFDKRYANRFIKYAIEILKELSEQKNEATDLFKCTLLITIIGKNKLFWLKVGDGFIVIEKAGNLELIGPLGKGDFANQTTFLTECINDNDISYGFIDVQDVTGVAAFTDGAGEKLVSSNGSQISRFLSKIFQNMRTGEFTKKEINEFLTDKNVWLRTTGDDKGIATLSYLD